MRLGSGVVKVTVGTGGAGYSSAPTVTVSGGGGTGASAVAILAGTAVDAVVLANPGKGYTSQPSISLSGGGGSGAAATATVLSYSGVVSLFKGRGNDMYGVDGKGRGFRWDGDTDYLEPLGIARPASAPTIAVTSGGSSGGVRSVAIVNGGAGYHSAPDVTFTGGGLTDGSTLHARARAKVSNARVVGVTIDSRGGHYTSVPQIAFSGGNGTGASLSVGALGRVASIEVVSSGSGYTSTPSPAGTPSVSITGDSSSNLISATAHGLTTGDPFYFTAITGSTDVSLNVTYYAASASATQFAVATTAGGAAIDITASITGGRIVNPAKHLFIACNNHGLTNGSTVRFTSLSGGAGVSVGTTYYARSVAATQFQLASTSGGSAVEFTTAIAGGALVLPPPKLTFHNLNGLTNANAEVVIGDGGIVSSVAVLAAGTGATTNGVTASISGGVGTGASLKVNLAYTVSSVTAVTAGTGYMVPPAIGFRPIGGGAVALASVSNGSISAVTVAGPGEYDSPPTAVVEPQDAKAIAVATQPMVGTYKCAIRYLDDTPASRGGPIPSSISELATVEVEGESSAFAWTWSNASMESRAAQVELWRTTADQTLVLYRVATLSPAAGVMPTTYVDTLSDNDLLDSSRSSFGIMPIVMPSGQLNARRFDPPPEECAVACVFQDRAWYTADTTGAKPNSLWYSEIDEPESVPRVNELVVQENATDSDAIVGITPFGSSLLIFQSRHVYALQYVAQPIIDASVMLMAYRGLLNPRCVDVYDGVAFVADAYGVYAFDGRSVDSVSVPIDNYWRDGLIDFSKKDVFHLRINPVERVVRLYYCKPGDGARPTRALCFCISTKAWWEETYPFPQSATVPVVSGGASRVLTAGAGTFYKPAAGELDAGGTPIPYEYRTGNLSLTDERSRSIGVLYRPTANQLQVRAHYNGSASARPNAITSDRGDGFQAIAGSASATLDMSPARSQLGTATGFARAYLSGRLDERSAGTDRHVAIAIGGSQTSADAATIHALSIEGATG